MAPWNVGADRSLGRQPTGSDLCDRYSATFKLWQVCAAHNPNVTTCAMFDLPLTFATAPHRA